VIQTPATLLAQTVVQGLQQLLMALHVLLLVVAAAVRLLPAVLQLMVVAAAGQG
jgi:hypothetical protein